MKPFAVGMLLIFACLINGRAQSDIFFDPCESEASISFEGKTQAGLDTHRLEVRKLAYTDTREPRPLVTSVSCVIYYAGREYGPEILLMMEAIPPVIVRRTSLGTVEIFLGRGVSRHIRQEWKLLGSTAQLLKEEEIAWKDDPRVNTGKKL